MTPSTPSENSSSVLRGTQLAVRRGGALVLQDADFALAGGECVSIVGPNGSGKTTLMLALLGLLPRAGGTVTFAGRDVGALTARERGCIAGYVPQGLGPLPAFTVYDVVAGGRYVHTAKRHTLSPADQAAIQAALETCGLTALATRPITGLSGGERQKAFLAAALAQDAWALALDEPNTALDPGYQLELVRILRDWTARGRALLVVSHDLQLPAALGGRIVALRGGRIVADGPADEILTVPRLTEIYGAQFGVVSTSDGRELVLPQWWQR